MNDWDLLIHINNYCFILESLHQNAFVVGNTIYFDRASLDEWWRFTHHSKSTTKMKTYNEIDPLLSSTINSWHVSLLGHSGIHASIHVILTVNLLQFIMLTSHTMWHWQDHDIITTSNSCLYIMLTWNFHTWPPMEGTSRNIPFSIPLDLNPLTFIRLGRFHNFDKRGTEECFILIPLFKNIDLSVSVMDLNT